MSQHREPTEAAELLAQSGRALFGEVQWLPQLAEALGGLNTRNLAAHFSGKTQLPMNHPIVLRTRDLLVQRRAEIDRILKAMDD